MCIVLFCYCYGNKALELLRMSGKFHCKTNKYVNYDIKIDILLNVWDTLYPDEKSAVIHKNVDCIEMKIFLLNEREKECTGSKKEER